MDKSQASTSYCPSTKTVKTEALSASSNSIDRNINGWLPCPHEQRRCLVSMWMDAAAIRRLRRLKLRRGRAYMTSSGWQIMFQAMSSQTTSWRRRYRRPDLFTSWPHFQILNVEHFKNENPRDQELEGRQPTSFEPYVFQSILLYSTSRYSKA
jgi:hypothetical protein